MEVGMRLDGTRDCRSSIDSGEKRWRRKAFQRKIE
jgi:hypothetical protein